MKISIRVELNPSLATVAATALPLTGFTYLATLTASGALSVHAMLPMLALSIMLAANLARPRPGK